MKIPLSDDNLDYLLKLLRKLEDSDVEAIRRVANSLFTLLTRNRHNE